MLPGNAVDQMHAAQPMETLYDPSMPHADFVKM